MLIADESSALGGARSSAHEFSIPRDENSFPGRWQASAGSWTASTSFLPSAGLKKPGDYGEIRCALPGLWSLTELSAIRRVWEGMLLPETGPPRSSLFPGPTAMMCFHSIVGHYRRTPRYRPPMPSLSPSWRKWPSSSLRVLC